MIDLKYSLIIEATDDPTFFGFYSPDLEGFTGIGHSIEDCLYQAKWGIAILTISENSTNPEPFPVCNGSPAPAADLSNLNICHVFAIAKVWRKFRFEAFTQMA